MPNELTFKEVCNYIKEDGKSDSKLLQAADTLLGVAIVCAPFALGPAGLALWPLLSVKNELTKVHQFVFRSQKEDDYFVRHQRMEVAYSLLVFTSFFEALEKEFPDELRQKVKLLQDQKVGLTKKASEKLPAPRSLPEEVIDALDTQKVEFPHPTESFTQQTERHKELWTQMGHGLYDFIQQTGVWDKLDDDEKMQVDEIRKNIPAKAEECFEAQYFELARKYEDFAIWANLHEHKQGKELIRSLSNYVQQHAELAKTNSKSIDIGFAKLHDTVSSIPEALDIHYSEEIVEKLKLHYTARLNEPIVKDESDSYEDGPSFPRVKEAFIPQSFQVLRKTHKVQSIEDERTWRDLSRRDDLAAFLASYLSSPYSIETPLVVLGHPGSGKSLMTTVLAAQLMSKHYTCIRIPLREVDADAGIVAQIEQRIGQITNLSSDTWAKVSGAFKNNPLLVILDGYDELLQASGKVFSGYLRQVQQFQQHQADLQRPVRVIVTSRITLIDKATIPQGATILRLLEFNKTQQDRWISIWNKANVKFFRAKQIEKFALPAEAEESAKKILPLAEQPLLLLMLALYDSEGNKLRESKTLDRTLLYNSLLRRFIRRERGKAETFRDLKEEEQNPHIESEMRRLGIAAIGMYNRRSLHILSPQLNEDLKFFASERPVEVSSDRPLSQADLLLGSFFFIHKAKAKQQAGAVEQHEEIAAFEFLHNTFGEFLTADFILQKTFSEVETIKALQTQPALKAQLEQKLQASDAFSPDWYACLIYTPLFTRPVVLEMMREWVVHILNAKRIAKRDFLTHLDTIILNQIKRVLSERELPAIMRDTAQGNRAPFGEHPLLGHIAIYSLNLILLRASLSGEAFSFDESQISIYDDGARPWDRLIHIWRSWFTLDVLNGVTAILIAERDGTQIKIQAKEQFQVAEGEHRLRTCLNVSRALGDNISSGLAGLLLFDAAGGNETELKAIAQQLASEKIDLDFKIRVKHLQLAAESVTWENARDYAREVEETLDIALSEDRREDVVSIVLSWEYAFTRLISHRPRRHEERIYWLRVIHPRQAARIASRNYLAARGIVRIARNLEDTGWLEYFARLATEILTDYLDVNRPNENIGGLLQLWGESLLYIPRGEYQDIMDYLYRRLDVRVVINITEANPESAVSLLKAVRASIGLGRGTHFRTSFAMDFAEEMLHPSTMSRLIERNPEVALSAVQLAKDLKGEEFIRHLRERFAEEYREIFSDMRFPPEARESNPRVTLAFLQVARELSDEPIPPRWLRLDRINLAYLLAEEPAAFAALLSWVRSTESRKDIAVMVEFLVNRLGGGEGARSLLEILPISALGDLYWLSKETNSAELRLALEYVGHLFN